MVTFSSSISHHHCPRTLINRKQRCNQGVGLCIDEATQRLVMNMDCSCLVLSSSAQCNLAHGIMGLPRGQKAKSLVLAVCVHPRRQITLPISFTSDGDVIKSESEPRSPWSLASLRRRLKGYLQQLIVTVSQSDRKFYWTLLNNVDFVRKIWSLALARCRPSTFSVNRCPAAMPRLK